MATVLILGLLHGLCVHIAKSGCIAFVCLYHTKKPSLKILFLFVRIASDVRVHVYTCMFIISMHFFEFEAAIKINGYHVLGI